MIGEKLRINRIGLVAVDLVATYLSLFLAYHLRFSFEVYPITKGIPPFQPYVALIPIITLIWPVVFYFRGLLQGRPQRSRVEEAFAVTLAVVVAALMLACAAPNQGPTRGNVPPAAQGSLAEVVAPAAAPAARLGAKGNLGGGIEIDDPLFSRTRRPRVTEWNDGLIGPIYENCRGGLGEPVKN